MLPPGSRRSKIRPPRRFLGSGSSGDGKEDPANEYEKSWMVLSNALVQIQNKNVSSLSYEQLYRKAYVLVLRKLGSKLYDDVSMLIRKHLGKKREYLMSILETSTMGLNSSVNEEFMKAVLLEWDEHLQAMKFISDVLMYLNRVYVKENKKLLIYDLGVQLFSEAIVRANDNELGLRLSAIVVDEIRKNRMGEYISTKMYITKVVSMLELLVESDNLTSDLQYGENYYQRYFEPMFIKSSEEYFTNLALELMTTPRGSRFLSDVDKFIEEEESRIKFYLPSSTHPKIIDLMNNIIIKDKIDSIICLPMEQEGLSYLLQPLVDKLTFQKSTYSEENHTKELRILYKLVGRTDSDRGLLKARFNEIINQQGSKLPSQISESFKSKDSCSTGKKSSANLAVFASVWIETVMEYQNQFNDLVRQCFSNDSSMEQCITQSIRDFINASSGFKNADVNNSAPEILSIYIDYQIKQLSKLTSSASKVAANNSTDNFTGSSVNQIDDFCTKSISFLRYIKDKDAFEAHYANHFAKRYLNSKGKSSGTGDLGKMDADLEDLIIAKLGEEMGTTSLEKVIRMNKDIKLSRDLTRDWRDFSKALRKEDLVDVELKICNVSDWPKSMTKDFKKFSTDDSSSEVKFIWPRQLRHTIREFEEYWVTGKKNDNKTLFWCPKFGSIDLRITYPSRTYDINMSTYAGIIMLLFAPQSKNSDGTEPLIFEEKREFKYTEIKELTGIPEVDLKRQLQSIAVAPRLRLLVKIPMTKEVNETDTFRLNEKFKSPSTKVKVLTVSASSSNSDSAPDSSRPNKQQPKVVDEDSEEVRAMILEGRKMEVNASIVRIMKSRRTISHNDLFAELIKQLGSRFQPSTILIKQRIEDLIEKEYLRRDDQDRGIYHYIA